MKKSICVIIIILTLVFTSCNIFSPIPDDPEGTVSTNLKDTYVLYRGIASFPYYENYYDYIQIHLLVSPTTLNTNCGVRVGASLGYLFDPGGTTITDEIGVADIGSIRGLGEVTEKPSSGYTLNCLITIGHGYVIRYKKSLASESDSTYYYARFYAEEWIMNTTGGISGVQVKIQNPF